MNKRPKALVAGIWAAVAIAALLSYANSFENGFVWDDASSVLIHRHVQDPAMFTQLFREDQHAFGRGQGNFYRPLTAASFMLDFALSHPEPVAKDEKLIDSLSPFVFHLDSLLWHTAAAILLGMLARRLGATAYVQAALPILWLLHPLHTEAVTYISGRADSMAAAFIFLGLYCAVSPARGLRGVAAALAMGASFVAGLLSKESATIFPVLLALVLLVRPTASDTPQTSDRLRSATLLAISVALLAAYVWLRMTVLKFAMGTSSAAAPLSTRATEAMQALAFYLKLVAVPTGLHMERTLDGVPGFVALLGVLALAVLLFLAWQAKRSGLNRATLGILWFLAAWLPISGLFPLNAPMAEHWLYVPLAGLLWATLEFVDRAARSPRVRLAVLAGTGLAGLWFLALTVERNRDWSDNETLYLATLRENPKSIRVQYNLAVTYEDLMGNMPAARRHYSEVLRLRAEEKQRAGTALNSYGDDELEAHLSLGRIALKDRAYDEAAPHFALLTRLQPTERNAALVIRAHYGLGECLYYGGDPEQALRYFQRAGRADPTLASEIQRRFGVTL